MANELPADGTRVRAMTYASEEYETGAKEVYGKFHTRHVPALDYMQCWVDGVQVDPATVHAADDAAFTDDLDGHWVTIEGTHVFIGKDGKIEKGPSAIVGKKPSELGKRIEKDHGPNHPETGTKEGPKGDEKKPHKKPAAAETKPSSQGGGEHNAEHRAAAEKYVAASPGLSAEQAAEYTERLAGALAALPAGIGKEAGTALKHGGVHFHPDLSTLRAEAVKLSGKGAAGVTGFAQDKGMATHVHLDGGDDPEGTAIHELWHAADNGGFHSDDKGWQAAYKRDILKGKHLLSRYALTNSSEGFAEFGRALAERGEEHMAAKFPNCVKHLKSKGLL